MWFMTATAVVLSILYLSIAVRIEKSLKVPEKHFLSESQRPPLDCVPNTGPQPSLETSVLSSHEGWPRDMTFLRSLHYLSTTQVLIWHLLIKTCACKCPLVISQGASFILFQVAIVKSPIHNPRQGWNDFPKDLCNFCYSRRSCVKEPYACSLQCQGLFLS